MKHELKIWPQYYARVKDGSKTFEIRDNDRGFQMGDELTLREWDPRKQNAAADKSQVIGYTNSEPLHFKIGYVHILDSSKVVFSLIPLKS